MYIITDVNMAQQFRISCKKFCKKPTLQFFIYAAFAFTLLHFILGGFHNEVESQLQTESPPRAIDFTPHIENVLTLYRKPFINMQDLKPETGKHCQQYFEEAVMHRSVEKNVFGGHVTSHVCLVTHFTPERLHMLQSLLPFWNGTIVAALYTENRDYTAVKNNVAELLKSEGRDNVIIHMVVKAGEFYPINFLRNVAMRSHRGCSYQFLTDIDFVPSPNLHSVLTDYVYQGAFNPRKREVLVVPAFSWMSKNENISINSTMLPKNKEQLLHMWDQNKVRQFHPQGNGHKSTDYKKWRQSTELYPVKYIEGYEPYILIPRVIAPYFIDLFLQRYGNKVSYFVELHARGYEFLVIPDGFVIHLPHPSLDLKSLFSRIGRCTTKVFNTLKAKLRVELNQTTI